MSNNYNSTLQSNNTDLQAILNTINELPNAGGSDLVLQDKTVVPTTSVQFITADSGYDGLDTVTVNAMPTVTQATPSIMINASGLITATATQTAGYVVAGTKSATKQLAFQSAKTITPTTVSQTAVSSGYYTGGAVTVKGDSNLIAENIKSGVSIFGVSGTYAGSGGNTSAEDGFITKSISGAYTNNRVTTIGSYAFCDCSTLSSVNFPLVTMINSYAFYGCSSLNSISFPMATNVKDGAFNGCKSISVVEFPSVSSIGSGAFTNCQKLTTAKFSSAIRIGSAAFYLCNSMNSASFPKVQTIFTSAFKACANLTTISMPSVKTIYSHAFSGCARLISLYITNSSLCTLSNSNAFGSTPIGGYSTTAGAYGSIYVPASLLTSYKTATNWAYFSSRFVGI